MQAKQIDRSVLTLAVEDAEIRSKLNQMSDDELEKTYEKNKQLYHNIERAIEKEREAIKPARKGEATKKDEPKYSKGNVLVRRDPNDNPYPKQSGEIELIEMIVGGQTNLGCLMDYCCLSLKWERATFLHTLYIIATPWHRKNNWRSMILFKTNRTGEITLHLQQIFPLELIKSIQSALCEINRQEETNSLQQNTTIIPPLQPRHYPISDECPYKYGKNKNQTYAVVWQILMNNKDGISLELLKKKVTEITRAAPDMIDEAISVVISRRNRDGRGRDPRALSGSGYWVERSQFGKLILHLPEQGEDSDDNGDTKKTSRKPTRMPI